MAAAPLLAQSGAQAWLAVEDPARPWPPLANGKPSAGPFYLVWTQPQASRISVRLPDPQRSRDGALDSALIGQLAASGVDYRFEAPGQGLAALLNALPVLLLFGLPAALLAVLLAVWVRRPRKRRL